MIHGYRASPLGQSTDFQSGSDYACAGGACQAMSPAARSAFAGLFNALNAASSALGGQCGFVPAGFIDGTTVGLAACVLGQDRVALSFPEVSGAFAANPTSDELASRALFYASRLTQISLSPPNPLIRITDPTVVTAPSDGGAPAPQPDVPPGTPPLAPGMPDADAARRKKIFAGVLIGVGVILGGAAAIVLAKQER